jgi:multisubunit Na+/H+ antiporter MnhG subunit
MTTSSLAVDLLLAAGTLCQLACCLGVLAGGDAFDRLHYAGAGSTLGPLLILAAIVIRHGIAVQSLDTLAAVGLMLALNPVLISATARAARLVHTGQIGPTADEARADRP